MRTGPLKDRLVPSTARRPKSTGSKVLWREQTLSNISTYSISVCLHARSSKLYSMNYSAASMLTGVFSYDKGTHTTCHIILCHAIPCSMRIISTSLHGPFTNEALGFGTVARRLHGRSQPCE